MQNYDLHGVRKPHWNYQDRESLHDLPDIEQIMKEKVKDILWEVERIDVEDPDTAHRVDGAKSLVSDLSSDVPREFNDFTEQYNAKEAMIADMTYSALAVTRSIEGIRDLIQASGADNPLVNRIKDMLDDARSECDDIFITSSQRFQDILTNFGWSDHERCYVKKILGSDFNPFMTVDSEASTTPSDITMSYNGALMFDGGSEVDIFMHDYALAISVKGTVTVKHNDGYAVHHFRDLLSTFEDFMCPTKAELAVYAMSTEKVWDVDDWIKPLQEKLK
ncbi:hypothetical protein Hena1_02450 [Erwinia phage Hena1]|uniref:Uncharacterized protein n=1 Tax=Erwinia phage Hena1 TaxID=2678601 RepID=A0A6B9J629_9CAUD|nr:hypothetical protein HWC84_gp119 [Erwinia phage Hena1]QGZ16395.1 hypothetical protein Hena1_02450 [Erwinia phage Hena1]